MIFSVKERFDKKEIYTYVSSILLAINPYENIGCDVNNYIYKTNNNNTNFNSITSPHIYNIASKCYENLIDNEKNQSIIITGESGSGKTESSKFILNYLTYSAGNNKNIDKILMSTIPMLEIFGNAKTFNNDNSSRYGKYLTIYFNSNGNILNGYIYN